MRGRGAGSALPDLVAEAEGGGKREEGGYGKEGRAFLEGLGENAAVAAGESRVCGAKYFSCGKGLARFWRVGGGSRMKLT